MEEKSKKNYDKYEMILYPKSNNYENMFIIDRMQCFCP
jgi:hypothetical protein